MRTDVLKNVYFQINPGTRAFGVEAMKHLYATYRRIFNDPSNDNLILSEKVANTFDKFMESYNIEIDTYCRYIFSILKFIDSSSFSDKQKYVDILVSILTQNEQLILYYAGAAGVDNLGYYELFEKYKIFRNLDLTKLIDTDHIKLYSEDVTNSSSN